MAAAFQNTKYKASKSLFKSEAPGMAALAASVNVTKTAQAQRAASNSGESLGFPQVASASGNSMPGTPGSAEGHGETSPSRAARAASRLGPAPKAGLYTIEQPALTHEVMATAAATAVNNIMMNMMPGGMPTGHTSGGHENGPGRHPSAHEGRDGLLPDPRAQPNSAGRHSPGGGSTNPNAPWNTPSIVSNTPYNTQHLNMEIHASGKRNGGRAAGEHYAPDMSGIRAASAMSTPLRMAELEAAGVLSSSKALALARAASSMGFIAPAASGLKTAPPAPSSLSVSTPMFLPSVKIGGPNGGASPSPVGGVAMAMQQALLLQSLDMLGPKYQPYTALDLAAETSYEGSPFTQSHSPMLHHHLAAAARATSPTPMRSAAAHDVAWFRGAHPKAHGVRREDVVELRHWLDKQLVRLAREAMALEQASDSPPQGTSSDVLPTPTLRHAAGGSAWFASEAAAAVLAAAVQRRESAPGSHHAPPKHVMSDYVAGALGGGPGGGVLREYELLGDNSSNSVGAGQVEIAAMLILNCEADGFVSSALLDRHEQLLNACIVELVGQVGTHCATRGHLMAQVWAAMRRLMAIMREERDKARAQCAAAHRAEDKANTAARDSLELLVGERAALMAVNQHLIDKLGNSRTEGAGYKAQAEELREAISNADLDDATTRIQDLKQRCKMAELVQKDHSTRLAAALAEAEERQREATDALARLGVQELELAQLRADMVMRTPRPRVTANIMDELVNPRQMEIINHTLTNGCPAMDMHRLLLGVSHTNVNMLAWAWAVGIARDVVTPWAAEQLAEKSSVAAATAAGDSLLSFAGSSGGGVGGRDATAGGPEPGSLPLSPTLVPTQRNSRPSQTGAQAGLAGAMTPQRTRTMFSVQGGVRTSDVGGGSGGGTVPESPGARPNLRLQIPQLAGRPRAAIKQAELLRADAERLFAWLRDLVRNQNVPMLRRHLPESALEVIAQALNMGADADSITCLLLAQCTPCGYDYWHIREFMGMLATKFHHSAADLGGPVSEALKLACMSSNERHKSLEAKYNNEHRELVRMKRQVSDYKKAERARTEAAIKEQAAKKEGRRTRPLKPLEVFIRAKWGDFFMGIGTAHDVPRILQVTGNVFNRHLDKVEAEKMVRAIWDSKETFDKENRHQKTSLAEHTHTFLQRKYVQPRAITEWGYNLIYTLGQHTYDPDCNLFLKVFLGDVEERIKDEQSDLQLDMINMLQLVDSATNDKVSGFLCKAEIRYALRGFFKDKSKSRLEECYEALDTDEPRDSVQYKRLFDDDVDLNQGIFAETILLQHLAERLECLQSIEDALLDAADSAKSAVCTPELLESVLKHAVPGISSESIEHYTKCVFSNTDKSGLAAQAEASMAQLSTSGRIHTAKGGGRRHGGSTHPALQPGQMGVHHAMRLVRRGWVDNLFSVGATIKVLSAASAFKKTLARFIAKAHASTERAAAQPSAAEAAANGDKHKRLYLRRMLYLRGLDAVREAWLDESRAKVDTAVAEAAAEAAGAGADPEAVAAASAAAVSHARAQRAVAMTHADHASEEDPELSALEAAMNATIATMDLRKRTLIGHEGNSLGSMSSRSIAAPSMSLSRHDVARLDMLRKLGSVMIAVAEDLPDAPSKMLDPDVRRTLYSGEMNDHESEDGDDDEGGED